ncbi:hypothetical protein AB0D86_24240 [Streptomyces sp. NPDC048324]|uniref:hypothetical protein n=1 Tax=Streptomyces sp. NPDC048324 TaxID=3157205 RepID=UPI00342A9C7D
MTRMRPPVGEFEPRRVEPGEHPALDEALALVNRDLAATLPEREPLRLMALASWEEGEPEDVYVALADGTWWGNQLPRTGAGTRDDPRAVLADVAEAAQDTVTERLRRAWPLCAVHNLGMHLGEEDGRPVWRCAGAGRDPGHVRAAVGELEAFHRPNRPNRKRKGKRNQGSPGRD